MDGYRMTLLSGARWTGASVVYSIHGFSPVQSAGLKAAAEAWAATIALDIRLVTSGQIAVSTTTAHPYAWAYDPPNGDILINVSTGLFNDVTPGSYGYFTMLHEFGHALGLRHGHDPEALPADRNGMPYSVMTYASYVGAPLDYYYNPRGNYAQTPMVEDIAALQSLYGANWGHAAGATVYRFDPTDAVIFKTIWDGGGFDTIDARDYTARVEIDLRPGYWSTLAPGQVASLSLDGGQKAPGTMALTRHADKRAWIESAVGGSGADLIIGNAADNRLIGMAGADMLRGGAGADAFVYFAADPGAVDHISDWTPGVDRIEIKFATDAVHVAGHTLWVNPAGDAGWSKLLTASAPLAGGDVIAF